MGHFQNTDLEPDIIVAAFAQAGQSDYPPLSLP